MKEKKKSEKDVKKLQELPDSLCKRRKKGIMKRNKTLKSKSVLKTTKECEKGNQCLCIKSDIWGSGKVFRR